MREANTEKLLIPGDIVKVTADVGDSITNRYNILDKNNNIVTISHSEYCSTTIDCFSIYDGILYDDEFIITANLSDARLYSICVENGRNIIRSETDHKNKHRSYTIHYNIDFTDLVDLSKKNGFKTVDVEEYVKHNTIYVKFVKFENDVYYYQISTERHYALYAAITDVLKSPHNIFDFDTIEVSDDDDDDVDNPKFYLMKLDQYKHITWKWSCDEKENHILYISDNAKGRKYIVDMKMVTDRFPEEIYRDNIHRVPLSVYVYEICGDTYKCSYWYQMEDLHEYFNNLPIWPRTVCECIQEPGRYEELVKMTEYYKKREENYEKMLEDYKKREEETLDKFKRALNELHKNAQNST